jgi:hypothetical protein
VEEAFGTILVVIVVIAVIIAALSYWGSGDMYDHIGKSGLSLDEPDLRPDPLPGTAAYDADAVAEIRQMLEAKSARLERRGEPPLDIDAEVAALTAPKLEIDAGLREEIRELVVARNARRVRRGEDPVDVETEVESEIRRLGDGG